MQLSVNGLDLRKRSFDGRYYEGREITVKGVCTDGVPVKKWTVTTRVNAANTTTTYDVEDLKITVPAGCDYVQIDSEPGSGGISEVVAEKMDCTMPVEVFDMQGRSLGTHSLPLSGLTPGVYVLRQGCTSAKVVVR
ncbi:MAG: T9SS type A sorting domain-containing protein [Muribaculaceae bacterium]|nr:T9SS type A sorting domain-containing protein [Muribaculaceae bacterium]